jgi:hypothetical protein
LQCVGIAGGHKIGDNPISPEYMKRVTAYSNAMGQLYEQYPKKEEEGAFYALSPLASEPPGDRGKASHDRPWQRL